MVCLTGGARKVEKVKNAREDEFGGRCLGIFGRLQGMLGVRTNGCPAVCLGTDQLDLKGTTSYWERKLSSEDTVIMVMFILLRLAILVLVKI
jgi:hypothetical protein